LIFEASNTIEVNEVECKLNLKSNILVIGRRESNTGLLLCHKSRVQNKPGIRNVSVR